MKYFNKKNFLILTLFILSIFFVSKYYTSKYESIDYQVLVSENDIEIRQYPELLLVSTTSNASTDDKKNVTFKRLFDFIGGENARKEEIDMTIPVFWTKLLKEFKMSFVAPKKYSFQTLPKPTNSQVFVEAQPSGKYLVITFNGSPELQNMNEQSKILMDYAEKNNIQIREGRLLAIYDPPWTIPFLRKNEILYLID
ncbi:MAG: heme-binding protein [Rickettsiales bacterium]